MSRPTNGQTWPRAAVDGRGVPTGGSTGQVLTKASDDDFDADWEDGGGSSGLPTPGSGDAGKVVTVNATEDGYELDQPGGSTKGPDVPPASPNTHDDEFNGTSLDASWTETDTPTGSAVVTYNDDLQGIKYQCPGQSSGNAFTIRKAVTGGIGNAGTAFWVTVKVGLSANSSNLSLSNIEVGNNATYAGGSYLDGNLANSGDFHASGWDGASTGDKTLAPGQGGLYIHIQRNTSNIMRLFFSLDGLNWRQISSQTKTWDIDYIFIRLYGSTTSSDPTTHRLHWMRVNDPRFKRNF